MTRDSYAGIVRQHAQIYRNNRPDGPASVEPFGWLSEDSDNIVSASLEAVPDKPHLCDLVEATGEFTVNQKPIVKYLNDIAQ